MIDLSQPFSDGMFSNPANGRVTLERCVRYEERGLNLTFASFPVHCGTHVDAPRHFFPNGRTIEQLKLDEVNGPAVCWSVNRGPGEEITVGDLETALPKVQKGDMLFIHTGWWRLFGDHEEYLKHPYLSVAGAKWLVSHGVKFLGIDIPSPDLPRIYREPGFDWPVHHELLGNDVLVAEHLANLDQVAGKRFRALALPIPMVGSDGAPARIVADVSAPSHDV